MKKHTPIFKRPKDPADVEIERLEALLDRCRWKPITRDVTARLTVTGDYVLVAGDSGYTTTPYRVEVCRYDPEYRPRSPWVNHANECFTDGGDPPTMYMELPDGWVEPAPPDTRAPWLR